MILRHKVFDIIKVLSSDDIESIITFCDGILDSREKQTDRQSLLKEVL